MKNEQGLTLTEILAAIVILSIIITTFLLVFVQSSQTTSNSKNILDATYYAETEMEEIIYSHSDQKPTSMNELTDWLLKRGYSSISDCNNCYGLKREDHYIFVQIKDAKENLGKIILKVYKDEKRVKQEAQMEMVVSWLK